MSEMSEIPEDVPTDRRDDMSENVPDLETEQSSPHWWEKALRAAIANFDEYADIVLRGLVRRAVRSSSEENERHDRQGSGGVGGSSDSFE